MILRAPGVGGPQPRLRCINVLFVYITGAICVRIYFAFMVMVGVVRYRIPRNWFENAYLEINYMTHNTVHASVVYLIFLFELRKPQNPKKLQEPFANMVLALGDYPLVVSRWSIYMLSSKIAVT